VLIEIEHRIVLERRAPERLQLSGSSNQTSAFTTIGLVARSMCSQAASAAGIE
jgi:hypothetical protein